MNLSALETDCLSRLSYNTSSVDATVKARLDRFLNETQQEILSEPGMEALLFDSITFASVASTATYALPPVVARIRQIRDASNLLLLQSRSLDWYRSAYPSPTAVTGIADSWVDLGFTAVSTQPSNASELFLVASSASDNGAGKKAYIEGYTTGGAYRAASAGSILTTGTTLSASITTWIEVTKFYLDFTPVGTIALVEDSASGTTLATLGIGQVSSRARTIALAACPATAVTYTVDFERDVTDLVDANDEPRLPYRFHRLLSIGARAKEYERQNDLSRFTAARTEYQVGLRKLKFFVYSQTVGTPNLRGRTSATRASRLGAQYGVDRW